ncbi:TolC family protein [bacterium]|nr:TolC family protein [bacterium]
MRRLLAGLVGALLLALPSCRVPVPTAQAPVEAPKAFSESGKAPVPDKWWTALGDSALDSLIDQAMAGNLDVQAAWDRLMQARAVARRAGAPLYPSVTGQAGARRDRVTREIEVTTPAPLGPMGIPMGTPTTRTTKTTTYENDFSLGLAASYELDLWGRVRSARDSAALAAQASREDVTTTAIAVTAEVAVTWYRLVDQLGQLGLLDEQIETNEKFLDLLTLRFRRGKVAATDVLQQEQLLEATRAEKLRAEARRDILRHQLAILLGRPPQATTQAASESLPALAPLPDTGLPAALIQKRPDVRGAWLRLAAAHQDVAAAVADRFPRISLTARVEAGAAETRDLFDNWLANLGANLTAPLLDGGLRKADVDRARARAAEQLHAYGQAILDALGEVEDALVEERQQEKFLANLARQVELSRKASEQTQDRYAKGAEDFLRVLTALQSYQNLQRRHLEARRELIEFRIGLYRALGGGWDMQPPAPGRRTP